MLQSKSDKGLVRAENQDALFVEKLNDSAAIIIVCDGMGGARGGAVASQLATELISEHIKQHSDFDNVEQLLLEAVDKANSVIFEKASAQEELFGMGTTVVAALIDKSNATVVHVGDSRAYLVGKSQITQLTVDHSYVQEMVDTGRISKEEARSHPKKNIITRALGVTQKVEAEINTAQLDDGQVILICTDGLINHVADEEILQILESSQSPVDELVELANSRGGTDNITIAVASKQ